MLQRNNLHWQCQPSYKWTTSNGRATDLLTCVSTGLCLMLSGLFSNNQPHNATKTVQGTSTPKWCLNLFYPVSEDREWNTILKLITHLSFVQKGKPFRLSCPKPFFKLDTFFQMKKGGKWHCWYKSGYSYMINQTDASQMKCHFDPLSVHLPEDLILQF